MIREHLRHTRHRQIHQRVLRHLRVLRHALVEVRVGRDQGIVAPLLKRDAVHLLRLYRGRGVGGVDLKDAVLPALLLREDFERGGLVAGGDDAVGDLVSLSEVFS